MNAIGQKIGDTRARVELWFGRWSQLAIRFRWLIIIATLIVVALMAPALGNIRIDSTVDSILKKNDPQRLIYDEFRHRYGRDEYFIVLVDAPHSVYDRAFLHKLSDLHHALETLPRIQEVESLVNARDTRGENDELIVDDMLEHVPQNAAELEQLKQRIAANSLVRKQFISKDQTSTLLIIKTDVYSKLGVPEETSDAILSDDAAFATDPLAVQSTATKSTAAKSPSTSSNATKKPKFITTKENQEILRAMEGLVANYDSDDFRIHLAGAPVMTEYLSQMLSHDMVVLTVLAIAMIVILLALIFRRLAIVLLPPLVSILATIFTVSSMVLMDIPVTMAVQILPCFLLAIGVGSCVHIFTAMFQAMESGEGKEAALRSAFERSGLAITMTSLTTAGGLVSFVFAEVEPVREFGIITPFGVLVTLYFSLVFLPALIAVLPIRHQHKPAEPKSNLITRFMELCATLSTQRPYLVIAVWALFVAGACYFIPQIRIDHNMIKWFPADHPVRVVTERINDEYGGVNTMDVEIDTGVENGLYNPVVLHKIDELYDFAHQQAKGDLQIGNILSVININKELHQALNNNDPAYYRIPDNRKLIAQELLLFENTGADDLERLVDSQFSRARVSINLPFVNAVSYAPFVDAMERKAQQLFAGLATTTVTGLVTIIGRTVEALIASMLNSYVVAFIVIVPLMMFILGSVRIGLLSMVPNLCPIIITLGLMGLVGVPLDLFTLLIGSIALGLSVDDTIHFMHNYQRYYHESGDSAVAVHKTLKTTGMALTFTSLILCASFLIYAASDMKNLFTFGWLTSYCLLVAFFADVLLAPALMTIRDQWRKSRALAAVS